MTGFLQVLAVKILSNDVIHHIYVFMVIKSITNLHKLCKYAYMQIFLFVFHCFYSYVFYCFYWVFFVCFFEEFISEVYEIN